MRPMRSYSRAGFACVLLLACGLCTRGRALEFAGGTGRPGDPFQVATAEQLISIGGDPVFLARHFVLVNDIDLDPNLPGGQVFERAVIAPTVGDAIFTGTFEGHGFKVLNLTIIAPEGAASPLALFGRIDSEGHISNLGLENAAVYGDPNSSNVAALVGSNAGKVQACYATGVVSGGSTVGGLCGENSGSIRDCYSTASVSGDVQVGGLVGRSSANTYSRAGIVGRGVVRCYSSGAVWAQEAGGGLIGECIGEILFDWDASFWDIEASGQEVSGGGLGLTTAQMREGAIFAAWGWDEDPNWVIDDGRDYPRLVWEETGGQPIAGDLADCFTGAGTAHDPYRISTAEQFALIGRLPNLSDKHFALEADLDLGRFTLRPIGDRWRAYNGFFHGNGHVLRHVFLSPDKSSAPSLFWAIGPNGYVSNLGLENVVATLSPGSSTIGPLALSNAGTITGCYATGRVTAEQGKAVGGLVGHNSGRVAYSHAAVDILGALSAGGLIGVQDSSGLVLECHAAGDIQRSPGTGTLAGFNYGLAANCYFRKGDKSPAAYPAGFPLDHAEMRQRESFAGWDFVGSSSDGPLDHWFMADANYPILSWQADLQGLRPIPDVSNMPLEWAQAEIELGGFVVGEITYDYHSTIPKEYAIVTSPLGLDAPGRVVNVVLSRGRYFPPSSYDRYDNHPLLIPIETPGQMEYFAGTFSGNLNLLLTQDIDMAGWEVLPPRTTSPSYPRALFTGTFLGNGHNLSNLKMFRGGLFDEIAPEGLVHGLVLENVTVGGSTSDSLGALAAVNRGTILSCSVRGTITGTGVAQNLGGLIGENDGIIAECRAAATIRGPLRDSEAPWGIIGPPGQGGLVGVNRYAIVDCYAVGDISGAGYVGGLVGRNFDPISRCYATTRVTDQAPENAGGLVGRNESSPLRRGQPVPLPVTDCYFLSTASGGGPDNGVGTALTTEQMGQQASFVGWDFADVWTICEGSDYPRLRWEGVECAAE